MDANTESMDNLGEAVKNWANFYTVLENVLETFHPSSKEESKNKIFHLKRRNIHQKLVKNLFQKLKKMLKS